MLNVRMVFVKLFWMCGVFRLVLLSMLVMVFLGFGLFWMFIVGLSR